MAKIRQEVEVNYECVKCHATDTVKLFPGQPAPPAINCWKCHAGLRITTVEEMVARGIGMFPVAA